MERSVTAGCMNGNLSGLCVEYFAFDADDITDIHFLEIFIGFFADTVPCHIGLDIALSDPAHCRRKPYP